jgi:PDZ domain
MKRLVLAFVALACICLGFVHPPSRAQASGTQAPASPGASQFNFAGNAAEIPADFTGNVAFIPVSVNQSRPSYFVLDSTAAISSIDPHRAAELGLTTTESAILNLNGVDIPLATLPQQASPNFGLQIGRVYEGTLGNDFFQRVVVEIDYGRLTVRLYDPSVYKYSGAGRALPLTFSGGVPIVQAKFTEPRGKVLEGGFLVNTALDASAVIYNRYADSHHLLRSHWKMIPTLNPDPDSAPEALLGRSKGFQLGSYFAEDTLVTFSKTDAPGASDSPIAGEIGAAMLRRFKVVLDYPHHQIILEPNPHFTPEEEEDKSGIAVIAKGTALKTFEIAEVEPHTPAAAAGLQKGDIIAGIDDDAAADLTLSEIRDLFRQIGHKYVLLIERNGQDKKVTVEMRRFL